MKASPRLLLGGAIFVTLMSLLVSCHGASSSSHLFGVLRRTIAVGKDISASNIYRLQDYSTVAAIVDLRGGASKRKSRTGSLTKTVTGKKKVGAKKAAASKKSNVDTVLQFYNDILPITRFYVSAIGLCTAIGLILGEERAQAVLALDPMRLFFGMEIWRPFTAASFLGKPSISWLMSGYYLYQYGSQLERAYGPAQYLIFLASQISLLTLLSTLLGVPFFTQCVITAMLHVLSRSTPNEKVQWLIFKVPYWTLPYGLMFADCLQAQSGVAAVPHIMGILTGHFYYFHRFIWPKTGGEDWLLAPGFLVEYMDPNAAAKNKGRESLNKALKNRKRKGKKLGSL
jgi:membrane associated rhomboid family serine protease